VWIFERFENARNVTTRALENHRYHEAAQTLWDFFWHDFCDWYLEAKKLRFREKSGIDEHWQAVLTIYEATLRLLHPFMPFITEELWQRLIHTQPAGDAQPKSISLAAYPTPRHPSAVNATGAKNFAMLQQVVTAARELRADHKLDPKSVLPASIRFRDFAFHDDDLPIVGALAKIALSQNREEAPADGLARSTADFDLHIYSGSPSQNGTSSGEGRARSLKEAAKLESLIENSCRQLSDETFISRAPGKVVDGLRRKLADYEAQLKKYRDQLGNG
jgi:valyl-tRNA synthetase